MKILFSGFNLKRKEGGWVYTLPYWAAKNYSSYWIDFKENKYFKVDKGLTEIQERNLPEFDLFFSRAIPKIKIPKIKSAFKVVYPILNREKVFEYDLVLTSKNFEKPISEKFFYYEEQAKEKTLVYPASVYPTKNQYNFVSQLNPETVKGIKFIFAGKIKEKKYADRVKQTLKRKKIQYEFLGKITQQELGSLFRKALGICLFSVKDENPRVINEALACNCPFLIGPNVNIPTEKKKAGIQINKIDEGLKKLLITDYGKTPAQYYQGNLREDLAYQKLFNLILEKWKKE